MRWPSVYNQLLDNFRKPAGFRSPASEDLDLLLFKGSQAAGSCWLEGIIIIKTKEECRETQTQHSH